MNQVPDLGIIWFLCPDCGAVLEACGGPSYMDGHIEPSRCRPCFHAWMFFPVTMFIPWSLLALGLFKEAICG